ncbi:MAG: DNA primase, partial [Proteobacteria bacterium]|nr:DNA primase [Pseudomonadota bacterium]
MATTLKEKILDSCDLQGLISDHVNLKASGNHQVGLCPFHQENTPSFHVYSDHFHCFGCHAHGDVISFVMKYHKLDFVGALRWLAKHVGLDDTELTARRQRDQGTVRQRKKTSQIFSEAQDYFSAHLWQQKTAESKEALAYLESRGFSETFLRHYGFGLAPAGSANLYLNLIKKGYHPSDLLACSLATRHPSGTYDFFSRRITLPIWDHKGHLIAFSGRLFTKNSSHTEPKYKNSRYPKNQILYGFHFAKKAIQNKKRAIVTEGYMDTLRLHSAGFLETVACQGTALTVSHIKSLSHVTSKVILLFDGDKAGEQAAFRVLPLSFDFPHLSFEIAQLPVGHDPDSFLSSHSQEDLEAILASAKPLLKELIAHKIA